MKNKLTELFLGEFSVVRRPAQEGAQTAIVKDEADGEVLILKAPLSSGERNALPDSAFLYVRGDVRALPYRNSSGGIDENHLRLAASMLERDQKIPESEKPGIRARIESLLRKDANGPLPGDVHVPCPGCGKPHAKGMPCPTCKEIQMKTDAEKIADLEKQLADSQKYGLLNDVEKAYYGRLPAQAQLAFLTKSATERAEMAKPTYVTKSGIAFTALDDQRLVEIAKAADADREAARVELEKAQNATWITKADREFSHLPGSVEHRALLLKDVAAIPDAARRDATMEILKAAEEIAKAAFGRQGSGSAKKVLKGGSAAQRLDAAVTKFAEDNKIPVVKAWDSFADTAEGRALYAEVETERKAALQS